MTLRVGIISANWGAIAHLPAWRSLPDVEVVAICTSRRETAEAAAGRHGIARPFWNAVEMCADPDIDIVDIGTRPSVRHEMVLAALRQGKHVYNGIPMARDFAAARELHQAWQASGSVAVVDAFSQWLPQFRTVKRMLDDGYLGTPFGGRACFNMSLFNRPIPDFGYNWFWEGGLGVSAVRNLGSHLLHGLVHLLGPVASVAADDSRLLDEWVFPDGRRQCVETNDFANLILRFESGLVMPVQVSWNAPIPEGWVLDIWGSDGRIATAAPSFPFPGTCTVSAARLPPVLAADRTGTETSVGTVPVPTSLAPIDPAGAFSREPGVTIDASFAVPPSFPMAIAMRSMVDAIAGKGAAAPDFGQAWQVERIQEAIRLASDGRRWVDLADVR